MCGAFEAKSRQSWDSGDVLFPEFTRFRMTLKSMKDWEDESTVQFLLEMMFIPVGVDVVNGCESWSFRWWRMCISILGVASMHSMVFSCRKGKEKALCGLLNTGGTC